jgi:transcriptional regulator with XRE-family HTH domain
MKLLEILLRIDQRQAELGLTDRALSVKATGSTDLIRNWRRTAADGKTASANHASLEKVAKALDVSLDWLLDGRRSEEEEEILRLVSQLDAPLRQRLLDFAEGLIASRPAPPRLPEADE